MEAKDIIEKAVSLGACGKSGKATDWKSLAWLFFSPQGREFCLKNNYPDIAIFRDIRQHIEPYGIFVEKKVDRKNKDTALIGGDDVSVLSFSGVEKAYKVILMHGAKAVIRLRNYAVVKIESAENCWFEVKNEDNTGVVL